MQVLKSIFLKIPCKIFRKIIHKWEYLYYRFFYSKPKLNINFIQKRNLIARDDDFDSIAPTYRELFPDKVQAKIAEADLICEHIFDLLGSGPKRLSPKGKNYQPIDWHSDFKSGNSWNPKTIYRNIRHGHVEGVDIKVPWELSRFQHLNILGQAYILTRDKKYAEEFASQITDWIKSNPVAFGVNWRCTMDVAIRASNWLVAQEYFSEKGLIPDNFWHEFYASIYEHGRFIKRHLENNFGFTSNHYLSDLVGLFFIAIYCPFLKESKKWQEFVLKELTNEIEKQVYPDGCNFEASTSYHRLVLELSFFSALLVVINDSEFNGENYERVCQKIFGEKYTKSLYKMFIAVLYLLKPNGRMPQIGDSDSGRFHVFANHEILDIRYLLTLGAIFFRETKFRVREFGFCEEALWIFGEKGYWIWKDLEENSYKNIKSRSFSHSGWYVMRHNNDYCLISCGPTGQGVNGAHAHNDKLSLELMMDGRDIFLDPGTYVYTSYPKERNKFRSTRYHNTIKFDGYEQNEIPEKDMFSLPEKVKIKEANLKEIDNNIVFQGEIQYAGITHKRMITLDNESGSWHIKDSSSCSETLNGNLMFHLSPNLISDGYHILIRETKEKIATIKVIESKIEKEEYDYSPEYGRKVKADCLVANISKTANVHEVNTYIRKIQ